MLFPVMLQQLIVIFITCCWAQQPGTKVEGNPLISVTECSSSGCSTKDHKLVLDANWRWIHDEKFQNCYTGNLWDTSICPDPESCAENCMLEGVDAGQYKNTYGVTPVPGLLSEAIQTQRAVNAAASTNLKRFEPSLHGQQQKVGPWTWTKDIKLFRTKLFRVGPRSKGSGLGTLGYDHLIISDKSHIP